MYVSLINCLYCGQDLLEDPCPTVRATAIHGVCRITGIFWELIPAHIIKMFLTTLVRETHWDQNNKGLSNLSILIVWVRDVLSWGGLLLVGDLKVIFRVKKFFTYMYTALTLTLHSGCPNISYMDQQLTTTSYNYFQCHPHLSNHTKTTDTPGLKEW